MYADDTDLSMLSLGELEAYGLTRAAFMLDHARKDIADKSAVVLALDHNMQTWVAIKTLAEMPECDLLDEVKDNLKSLCRYVTDTTFRYGANATEDILDILQLINLRISAGMLDAVGSRA
jgi:flagellar biosynthesis activator protein FlaF